MTTVESRVGGPLFFVMAVALVAEVLATISEESFSLEHMILHRDYSYDPEGEAQSDVKNEFNQYVELMAEIKRSSDLSKTAVETILSDTDNLQFANSRLADYGDLVKRVERLNSAVDELEYKVWVSLPLWESLFLFPPFLDRYE